MTREEVISKIKEKCDIINDIADYQLAYGEIREIQETLNEILEIVKTVVPEREKGEWILDETDNSIECNKCLCQIYPNDIFYGEPHFCPNCGADMRGKQQ